MAIPIKCPGCQAAFDVPETLAGKTIRCTSCKTQLTVPAAASVAAAAGSGEKKPFGWAANGSSAPTAKPAPAAKPAPPVAKAAPVPAKPAAKKVVELDDDEDDKPRPSKSSKPPAGAKSSKPAPRRRDDDDDDEDDRPARPRGKKKQGSGSGMMLLIGGGVVGLLAIVGVVVFLMMGSKDKKDTAKNSDSGSSPTPTTPMSGPPGGAGGPPTPGGSGGPPPGMSSRPPGMGGPPPGMGGPPGGGGPTPMDGSAAPTPDGMGPGGMGPGMGMGPGGPGGPGFPGGPGYPGGSFSSRPPGGPMFPGAPGGAAVKIPEGWVAVNGDGFSCAMPAEPTVKDTKAGMVKAKEYLLLKQTEQEMFVVKVVYLDAKPPPALAAQALKLEVDNLKTTLEATGLSARGDTDINLGGNPGKELKFADKNNGGVTARLYLAGDHFYAVIGGGDKLPLGDEKVQQFLDSFRLTGGQLAMGGPGFPGAPPGMGGSAGGPPPGFGGSAGGPPPGFGGSAGGPPPGMSARPPGAGGSASGPPPGFGSGGPRPMGGFSSPPPGVGGGGPAPMFPGAGGAPGNPGGFGGPPGYGGPGEFGGNLQNGPNAPPAGAATSPHLAHNLDPFYAFAFDAERKEFYTVGMRIDVKARKARGTLRRISYPDFKVKEYNLPFVAIRAAIDPKKGVLYLGTVTTQAQAALGELWQMGFDRVGFDQALATGDVQVFDLGPIRDGKVLDGGDVKASASFAIGGEVCGLELSDDGQFLTAAVKKKVGNSYKSWLRLYDTGERKFVKEVALPEPCSDMRKSMDGKQLLVVGFPGNAKTETTSIMSYDPTTLAAGKKSRSKGLSTDIAPRPGGGMVVAVTGPATGRDIGLNAGLLHAVDPDGGSQEILITGWRASHNNYAKFTPDGKHLFVSSIAGRNGTKMQNPGLDVYVPDEKAETGFRKAASIRYAVRVNTGVSVGGHFHVTPDGEYVIFHSGAVIAVKQATVNAENAASVPDPDAPLGGGFQGGPGAGGPGGGFPGGFPGGGGAPGGMAPPGGPGFPGAPPGGGVPLGGAGPPGMAPGGAPGGPGRGRGRGRAPGGQGGQGGPGFPAAPPGGM